MYCHYNLCDCYFEKDNYLHCCKIPKGYISNSSHISDYVNIVEITSTQPRFAYNRFPKQKILGNDRMETVSTEVTSVRCRNKHRKIQMENSSIFC